MLGRGGGRPRARRDLRLLLRIAMVAQAAPPDSLGRKSKTGTRTLGYFLTSRGEATVVGTWGQRLRSYGL